MEIIVVREALTFDCLAEIEALGDGKPSAIRMIEVLNPVIAGGVGKLNIAQLHDIVSAIMQEVARMSNPKAEVEP